MSLPVGIKSAQTLTNAYLMARPDSLEIVPKGCSAVNISAFNPASLEQTAFAKDLQDTLGPQHPLVTYWAENIIAPAQAFIEGQVDLDNDVWTVTPDEFRAAYGDTRDERGVLLSDNACGAFQVASDLMKEYQGLTVTAPDAPATMDPEGLKIIPQGLSTAPSISDAYLMYLPNDSETIPDGVIPAGTKVDLNVFTGTQGQEFYQWLQKNNTELAKKWEDQILAPANAFQTQKGLTEVSQDDLLGVYGDKESAGNQAQAFLMSQHIVTSFHTKPQAKEVQQELDAGLPVDAAPAQPDAGVNTTGAIAQPSTEIPWGKIGAGAGVLGAAILITAIVAYKRGQKNMEASAALAAGAAKSTQAPAPAQQVVTISTAAPAAASVGTPAVDDEISKAVQSMAGGNQEPKA